MILLGHTYSACPVWLSSGPLEFFTFSYCAWPWNWLICFVLFLLWRIVKWTRTSSLRPFSMEFEREPGGPLSPWQLLGKSCCCYCCRCFVVVFQILFVFLISILFKGVLAGAKSVQLQALADSSLSISTSLLLNIEAEYKLNFTVFLSGFDTWKLLYFV